jgi:hypothetical protein
MAMTPPKCSVQFPTHRPLPVAVRGGVSANEALECITNSAPIIGDGEGSRPGRAGRLLRR